MNDSVLIKTKMVTIGTDIHLSVHATACADFENKFERKTQSTRFHQTSQARHVLGWPLFQCVHEIIEIFMVVAV